MKIITVIGARPQFIKASVVSRAFAQRGIQEIIIHTGQHFDANMSDVFFEEMQIPKPDYNLMIHGLSHGAMTGQMLEKIEGILISEKPDYLLVYGDTNSTLAGALAAAKIHIPVIHIEAGLRSFNMNMPEEINRILTDRISSILFCPTDTAVKNLEAEGFGKHGVQIINSGDVMEDTALYYNHLAREKSHILSDLGLRPGEYVLTTIHRAENTDREENLREIIEGLEAINRELRVVLPLHPRTRATLAKWGIHPAIMLTDPVGYLDMTVLTSSAALVMTDSGGLQKEAFFFNKYCITMREETEWVELTDNGYNFLSGCDRKKMLDYFNNLKNKAFHKKHNFYGGGTASSKIGDYMKQHG